MATRELTPPAVPVAATLLWTALAVGTLGVVAPGCWQPPDYPLGTFCASPTNGAEYCVSADQAPEAAWSQAAAHGAEPIQMWAKWPSEVALDDLVASSNKVAAWFRDIDTVSAYVRDQRRNAESYRASMAGNLGALLQLALFRQTELLASRPDPIGSFKAALEAKAAAEEDPLVAEIAMDKQTMASVQVVFDKAQADAAPLATAYAAKWAAAGSDRDHIGERGRDEDRQGARGRGTLVSM